MADRSVGKTQPLALVMGACGGMGKACARRLGQQHRVLLADMNGAQLESDASELADEGIAVIAQVCDVTSDDSVAQLMTRVKAEGPLASLAHVVGLSPIAGNWRNIMAVNLQGAQRVANQVVSTMEHGAGVFISSLAGHNINDLAHLHELLDDPLQDSFLDKLEAALDGEINPTRSYQISKYGLNRMCRRLAFDWGVAGNRILSLSPGLIATPMGEREFENSPQKWDLLKRTPLQRQGSLQEICDALEFLVSDRASFISGTDLLVDGGIAAAVAHG